MDVAAGPAGSRGVELLGRDEELARLYDLIDGIGRRGGALIVRREDGIGKDARLDAAAERAGARGVTVMWARGMPSEATFAFAGLHQLLLPFLDTRDRLPPPQRGAVERAFALVEGDA